MNELYNYDIAVKNYIKLNVFNNTVYMHYKDIITIRFWYEDVLLYQAFS